VMCFVFSLGGEKAEKENVITTKKVAEQRAGLQP